MKKHVIGQTVMILLYALLGLFLGLYAAPAVNRLTAPGRTTAESLLHLAVLLFLLVVSVMFHLAIHEAGHLVFGLLSGYRFSSFRVGSLMLIKKNGRYRFRRFSLPGTGGQCLLDPPDLKDGRIPFASYFLGGAIFNLAAALVFWLLYHRAGDRSALSLFLLLLTVFGLLFALSNGIPLRTKLVDNDGYHVVHLRKNSEAVRCLWLQMKIQALVADDQRLRDMPEVWFDLTAIPVLDNSLCAAVGLLACSRAMDRQDFAAADRIAAALLEKATGLNGLHRSLLITERIFCALVGQSETDMLEQMKDKAYQVFLKSMAAYPAVIRVQYAYALLKSHDTAAADRWLAAFEKIAATYPYASEIDGERELLAVARVRWSGLDQNTPDFTDSLAEK